jgi:alkylhydroperoxidase family enzyme
VLVLHRTQSSIADRALPAPIFADWRDGRAGPAVTAAAHFLVKLTNTPDEVGPADVQAARHAGVSETALADAVYIAFLFNLINRVADALEFRHRSERDRVRGADMLRRGGYRLPGFLFG